MVLDFPKFFIFPDAEPEFSEAIQEITGVFTLSG